MADNYKHIVTFDNKIMNNIVTFPNDPEELKPAVFTSSEEPKVTKIDPVADVPSAFVMPASAIEPKQTNDVVVRFADVITELSSSNELYQSEKKRDLKPATFGNKTESLLVEEFRKSPIHGTIPPAEVFNFEARMRQFENPTVNLISTWGEQPIAAVGRITTRVNDLTRSSVFVDGNTLLNNTLTALAGANKKESNLIGKLFNRNTNTVAEQKPKIIALRTQLLSWLPQCKQHADDVSKLTRELIILSEMLSIGAKYAEHNTDNILEQTFFNKRTILQQSILQSQTTKLAAEQLEQSIGEQLIRADQMLNVTIPTYEQAQVNKN